MSTSTKFQVGLLFLSMALVRHPLWAQVNIEMVYVQGGTYTMGATAEQQEAAENNEKPAHDVTLADFYIGKYEVTQAQWIAIMGTNPSKNVGNNLPVGSVSWDDVQIFIKKLNAKTGMDYRLPTEAEWEYAARGGKYRSPYITSGSDRIEEVGWSEADDIYNSQPVGSRLPNALGIYDMSGNLWEWCQDWYGEHYYEKSPTHNPQGPTSNPDNYRVIRGGSVDFNPWYCRVSARGYCVQNKNVVDYGDDNLGFRLCYTKGGASASPSPNQNSCNGVTDYDGNTYKTIQMGPQCWMAENLKTTHYADGTKINFGKKESLTVPYYHYPDGKSSKATAYGLTYNWAAVMHNASSSKDIPSGVQGICPEGWHVPSIREWEVLESYVDSQEQYRCKGITTYIAKALCSNEGWEEVDNTCAIGNDQSQNNSTGFNIKPSFLGCAAYFWTATELHENNYAVDVSFIATNPDIFHNHNTSNNHKTHQYSVRCIKN